MGLRGSPGEKATCMDGVEEDEGVKFLGNYCDLAKTRESAKPPQNN